MEMRKDKIHFASDLYVHQRNLRSIGSGKRLICMISTGNRKFHTNFLLIRYIPMALFQYKNHISPTLIYVKSKDLLIFSFRQKSIVRFKMANSLIICIHNSEERMIEHVEVSKMKKRKNYSSPLALVYQPIYFLLQFFYQKP